MPKTKPPRTPDCGPECAELSEREHGFLLLYLAMHTGEGPTKQEDCYREAFADKKKTDASVRSAASRLANSVNFQAALAAHRTAEHARYIASKDASVERASRTADAASLEHFLEIAEDGKLRLKALDPRSRRLLRGLASYRERVVKDACGEDDSEVVIDREIKVRDPTASERYLATVGGWNAPTKTEDVTGKALLARLRAILDNPATSDDMAAVATRALERLAKDEPSDKVMADFAADALALGAGSKE